LAWAIEGSRIAAVSMVATVTLIVLIMVFVM